MRRSKFTQEPILFALKQVAAGQPVADVCRQMGISEATFYGWKKRYCSLGLLEVRELRRLRDENARLNRWVVELTLERHILQEVVKRRPDRGQASRLRSIDTRLLSTQRPPVLCTDSPRERDLVLPFAENSFIESFNGRLRDECLNVHEFATLVDVRAVLNAWRDDLINILMCASFR